jgi:hypothetical protein
MTDTKTLAAFIATNKIKARAAWTDRNPHMEGSDRMDNWKVQLRMGAKRLSVYFSMGMGHGGAEPGADDVLNCLASDAAGIENASSFEDWCDEYGYDTDSRKHLRTFKVCERQAEKLKAFLGDDLYRELLWETERL